MIPKIIHYCWVGGAPKPKSVLYCIESWKKFCPDYEIREWNETNYDFTKNEYMKQSYEAKKWGFVPDYARLDIIYKHGGIYLDTDVEIIKSFDELLEQKAFMGFENTGDGEFFVNCGHGFGAEAFHEIIGEIRDTYEHIQFLNNDGTYNMLPSPHYTTQSLKKYGLVQENREQQLKDMIIYDSTVFCPKNFRTGNISKTDRTVSIHHFTASWMDNEIKRELKHIQKINNIFGKNLGKYILLGESVLEKYSLLELITKLPKRLMQKGKNEIINYIEMKPYIQGIYLARRLEEGTGEGILLDTAIESDNCGDYIIMDCCQKQLAGMVEVTKMQHIPTHRFVTKEEESELKKSSYKILCGTNILSGHMRNYGLWKLGPDISPYKNTILMGVGFDSEGVDYDFYTKKFFETILSSKNVHSVRDSFSCKQLQKMGIKNVINTGCPTMWNLTPEMCKKIPITKGKNVVCTITDYCRDSQMDKAMLEILLQKYQLVYFWVQGQDDLQYLRELGFEDRVNIVPPDLKAYDEILKQPNLDYVGTRLHAGIRALSYGHRSLVIAIDNRARCIARDTGLNIVERSEVPRVLADIIQADFKTELYLPWDNIDKWKMQFR